MRNILNVDLTNINCNGVCSSACGSNRSEIILSTKNLELKEPYLEFGLDEASKITGEAEGKNIHITDSAEEPLAAFSREKATTLM